MTLEECIKKMAEGFRQERNKYVNGYGIILEPVNGDKDNWKFFQHKSRWCYANLKDSRPDRGEIDAWYWNTIEHRVRYFVDFFNKNVDGYCGYKPGSKGHKQQQVLWRYIIQKSMFRSVFVKDTFENQLENGVMFDMQKNKWGAILSACVALRNVHEYPLTQVYRTLRYNGVSQTMAWLMAHNHTVSRVGSVHHDQRGGHGLMTGDKMTIESLKAIYQGKHVSHKGCAASEKLHCGNTAYMNIRNKGQTIMDWFTQIRGKAEGKGWNARYQPVTKEIFINAVIELEKSFK